MMLTVPATAFTSRSIRACAVRSAIASWSLTLVDAVDCWTDSSHGDSAAECAVGAGAHEVQARAADGRSDATVAMIRNVVRSEGVSGLFRGVWPTLWRDVPFSMR